MPEERPELMVVGDSIAQGVQTLSFQRALALQSVGVRLAEMNGWDFLPADHPKPVLLDFEDEIRNLDI